MFFVENILALSSYTKVVVVAAVVIVVSTALDFDDGLLLFVFVELL